MGGPDPEGYRKCVIVCVGPWVQWQIIFKVSLRIFMLRASLFTYSNMLKQHILIGKPRLIVMAGWLKSGV